MAMWNDYEKIARRLDRIANAFERIANALETANIIEADSFPKPQRDDIGNCNICKYVGLEHRCNQCVNGSQFYKVEDEAQYDIDKGTIKCDNCSESGSYKCSKCDGEMYFKRLEIEDEPQTDCSWQKGE